MKNKIRKGFTLVELLVVIVILAAFGGIIYGAMNGLSAADEEATYEQQEWQEPQAEQGPSPHDELLEQMKEQNALLKQQIELQKQGK